MRFTIELKSEKCRVSKKTEPPKRPRGRPVTGRPPKRNMTMRLAVDVAEYLDTVENKAEAVETAVRASESYQAREAKNEQSTR